MFSAYTRLEVTKNVSVVFDCIAGNGEFKWGNWAYLIDEFIFVFFC